MLKGRIKSATQWVAEQAVRALFRELFDALLQQWRE